MAVGMAQSSLIKLEPQMARLFRAIHAHLHSFAVDEHEVLNMVSIYRVIVAMELREYSPVVAQACSLYKSEAHTILRQREKKTLLSVSQF